MSAIGRRLFTFVFLGVACAPAILAFPIPPIFPSSGRAAGGEGVAIRVDEVWSGCWVSIGGVPATGCARQTEYLLHATTPALPPGTLNTVTGVAYPSGPFTYPDAWMADFLDVPRTDGFHDSVEILLRNGITAGCGGGYYCRANAVRRDQMAVFLLKARYGAGNLPPPCTPPGRFRDVPCPGPFTDWIEQLHVDGITNGCAPGLYCPAASVQRDQMAVLLLRAKHGAAYDPPDCSGIFADVPCKPEEGFADWIEQLALEGITAGCGDGNYCPGGSSTRGQMAAFLTKTFDLP